MNKISHTVLFDCATAKHTGTQTLPCENEVEQGKQATQASYADACCNSASESRFKPHLRSLSLCSNRLESNQPSCSPSLKPLSRELHSSQCVKCVCASVERRCIAPVERERACRLFWLWLSTGIVLTAHCRSPSFLFILNQWPPCS